MPNYRIATVFTAKDRVSKALAKMSTRSKQFGDRTDKAFRKASASASRFKDVVKGIVVSRVIMGGLRMLGLGIRAAGEEFINFDDALTQAAAKFGGIQRGSKDFEMLSLAARKTGKETKFSAVEAAEGLNFLAMAGFSAEQSVAALPSVTDLAVVGNMDLARATDIASDALGAFGLQTKDSAKLAENLTRVNDVFAKTITTSNVDLEMLFESMKDGGPVATAAGASIETFAALTGVMGNAGIKGSKAGTTLKNMFLQLAGPTGAGAAQLKKFGIKTKDAQGNMRDMIDILEDLQIATKNMGSAERSAAIDRIFGKRAIAGVNVLLDKGADELRDYRGVLLDVKGVSRSMAEEINKSLGNQLLALKSALIELGIKFFDAFKTKGQKGLEGLIEAARNFDIKPIVNGVNQVIDIFKIFMDNAELIKSALIIMGGIWVAFKAKLIAVTAAQWALNAAMLANPVGLITAAIGLLIGAIVLLVMHWDTVKKAVMDFGGAVQEYVILGMQKMKNVAFDALLSILGLAQKVVNFLGFTGAGATLEGLMGLTQKMKDAETAAFYAGADAASANKYKTRLGGIDFRGTRGGPENFRELEQSVPQDFETGQSVFDATLTFENPPPNMKLKKKKGNGAPNVNIEGLGANA